MSDQYGDGAVCCWLAARPEVRHETDQIMALLTDLVALLRPYGISFLETSEPRRYRLTVGGWRGLREAIAAGRCEDVGWSSNPLPFGRHVRGTLNLSLGRQWVADSELAVCVFARLRTDDLSERQAALSPFLAFAEHWFATWEAAAAFVSDRPADDDTLTVHEGMQHLPPLANSWPAVCRYVRGVFWAMGLGQALCQRLGGRDQIVCDAPAPIVRPLGTGVWFQLSAQPLAPSETYQRLAAYLSPLLRWTVADLRAPAALGTPDRPMGVTSALRTREGEPVPVVLAAPLEADVALNVHLAELPTPSRVAAIEDAVRAWYDRGFSGEFGGAGFHYLGAPSVDMTGRAVRWTADLGSADPRRAVDALAASLATVRGARIVRLTLGIEDVA